jgi:two-component system cell cycle response regulator
MARILVIEDNPANLELMTYLLRAYKYEPMAALDGETGLELARTERPEVVVCDIQLPKMDGFEVVRRLKADPATAAIPVIAVTALAMVGDRDRALAAGFDGYIGKPIVPESFVSQIEQFFKPTRSARPQPAWDAAEATSPARAAYAGARILVVDNTPANRDLLVQTLAPVGYNVVTVSSVTAAMAAARAFIPDLIISDVHMPGQGGLELLAQIKADPELRGVPFVFASASVLDEAEQRRALAHGADLFLLQPTEPATLIARIHSLLEKGKPHGDHPRS